MTYVQTWPKDFNVQSFSPCYLQTADSAPRILIVTEPKVPGCSVQGLSWLVERSSRLFGNEQPRILYLEGPLDTHNQDFEGLTSRIQENVLSLQPQS